MDKKRIGEGVGFTSALERLTLAFEADVEGVPTSLISKRPTEEAAIRNVAMHYRLYEREQLFYEQIAPLSALPLPRVYHSAGDPEQQAFNLLLEDVPARTGNQLGDTPVEEIRLALDHIAPLHARFWNRPVDKEHPWIPSVRDRDYFARIDVTYRAGLTAFIEKQGDTLPTLPPEFNDVARRYGDVSMRLWEESQGWVSTIVHGDFRVDNMMFEPGDERPIVFIDWQMISHGNPLIDAAYLLAGSMTPEARRKHEHGLLTGYHAALVKHGVEGFEFNECQLHYRRATLLLLLYVVLNQHLLAGGWEEANERGLTLKDMMYERFAAAILDVDPDELLAGT